ncbi:MAG: hypothetical protein N2D54_04075, partial [Chloroflexota bacterium]
MQSKSQIQLKRVNLIRFILPIILFTIVTMYETWEHWILKGDIFFDIHWTSEVGFFGVLGPSAVFIVLSYVVSLLKKQTETSEN